MGMERRPTIKLAPGEHIIGLLPEYHQGPGWTNATIEVVIGSYNTKTHRIETVQFDDFNRDQRLLFSIAADVYEKLRNTLDVVRVNDKGLNGRNRND